MSDVVYDGTFTLAWLADDEEVCSAGDGSGACIILSPRGDLRVDIGDVIEVPRAR